MILQVLRVVLVDDVMQTIAEATLVVPAGAALYFYLDILLFLIKNR